MSVTLVASVIVSFTFIPLVAYYLIKPPKQVEEPMSSGASTASPASTTASATSRCSTAGRCSRAP